METKVVKRMEEGSSRRNKLVDLKSGRRQVAEWINRMDIRRVIHRPAINCG